ncbi:MAG: hypothetical protein CVU64_08285 [Deltaproteobacteria bacterium HGW-Deltaproteobacteria-21]|nr:MAG: hypothetical protein CVU64_08285 [Deltaproteobacteria bacterium HGW-Deltaproteobacteria-21]
MPQRAHDTNYPPYLTLASCHTKEPHLKTRCPKALVNLKKDCIQPILVIVDLFAKRFLLTSLALLFLPASIFAGTLRISSDGAPVATIVIPDNPSRAEEFASAELKVHLDKITGGKFRVARENDSLLPRQIHVGRTSFASYFKPQLGPESFTFAYGGTRLAIIGGDEAGTIFGVYDFLERLGVCWYLPDVLGTVIPSKPTLAVPLLSVTLKPAFSLRGLDGGIWGLRNRCNFPTSQALPIPAFADEHRSRIHDLHLWLDPEIYYPTHPEYYALVQGSRDPFRFHNGKKEFWKPAAGNAGAASTIAANIVAYNKTHPEVKRFFLSPPDGLNHSESPQSLALDDTVNRPSWARYSRRYYLFYNAVAEKVKGAAPELKVIGYAYAHYNYPPIDRSVKAQDNLQIMVAHYTPFDLARPMNDPESPCNKQFISTLDGWEELVGRNLFIFEYYWKCRIRVFNGYTQHLVVLIS